MKLVSTILRLIFGAVFMFSGFVKAVDPWGTAYKIEEYFSAFSMGWLSEKISFLPITVSVILCCLEFMVGVLMFFGFFRKVVKPAAVVFMSFFTVLTFIDALTNRVSDCGCFGDAIKLSNWETFWKNVVLDFALLGIYLSERKMRFATSPVNSKLLTAFFSVAVLAFAVYNTVYEPVIDFRAWKIGNQMVAVGDERMPPVSFATYKNNATGEVKEFETEDLMEAYRKNPNFASEWSFMDSRVENTNTVAADGFSLQALGFEEDETMEILSDTTSDLYMISSYDLRKTSGKGMKRVLAFGDKAVETGARVIFVTASSVANCDAFIEKYKVGNIVFYSADDKAIKTMLRSNPGVVKISKGKVADKWSWRSLPEPTEYFK